jgi:hypothetical protein
VRVVEDDDGDPIAVRYGSRTFAVSQVYRVAGPSWQDTPGYIFGTSAVRPLADSLDTVRSSKRNARNAAKRGRPDLILHGSHDMLLSQDAIDAITERYDDRMRGTDGSGGAFFVGAGIEVTPAGFAPKDLEFASVHAMANNDTQMVCGVPAVRLGLPDAQYGTAKAQYRQYWDALRNLQSQIDEEDTRMVRDITGDPTLWVWTDFSRVEALQDSYTERLTRAGILVQQFGAAPADALRYEGFADAPSGKAPANAPAARPPPIEPDDQGEKRSLRAALALYVAGAADRYDEATDLEIARETECGIMFGVLTSHGVRAPIARALAGEWAALTHHQVVTAGGTRGIRAASLDHARRLAEIAEAK